MTTAGARALLSDLVDYARLFPPAYRENILIIYRKATPTQASESEDSIEFREIKNINLLELIDTDPHLHLLKKLIPDIILVRGLLPYKKIQQFHLPHCNQVAHAPQNQ